MRTECHYPCQKCFKRVPRHLWGRVSRLAQVSNNEANCATDLLNTRQRRRHHWGPHANITIATYTYLIGPQPPSRNKDRIFPISLRSPPRVPDSRTTAEVPVRRSLGHVPIIDVYTCWVWTDGRWIVPDKWTVEIGLVIGGLYLMGPGNGKLPVEAPKACAFAEGVCLSPTYKAWVWRSFNGSSCSRAYSLSLSLTSLLSVFDFTFW